MMGWTAVVHMVMRMMMCDTVMVSMMIVRTVVSSVVVTMTRSVMVPFLMKVWVLIKRRMRATVKRL